MQKLPTLKQPRTRFKALYNFHLTQEPAVIRYLDPNNREDFIRYKRIFTNPMVQKYMEGVKGKITNAVIKKTLNPKDNDIRFAITTTEKDKLMGWVQFVPEETQRLKRLTMNLDLNLSLPACLLRSESKRALPRENLPGRLVPNSLPYPAWSLAVTTRVLPY